MIPRREPGDAGVAERQRARRQDRRPHGRRKRRGELRHAERQRPREEQRDEEPSHEEKQNVMAVSGQQPRRVVFQPEPLERHQANARAPLDELADDGVHEGHAGGVEQEGPEMVGDRRPQRPRRRQPDAAQEEEQRHVVDVDVDRVEDRKRDVPDDHENDGEALGRVDLGPLEKVVRVVHMPPHTTIRRIHTVRDREWQPRRAWHPGRSGTGERLARCRPALLNSRRPVRGAHQTKAMIPCAE